GPSGCGRTLRLRRANVASSMSVSRAKPASLIFTRTRSELANTAARIAVDADHVQHRRIAGAKQRPNCKCHRHRLGRRDLAIEALVAPADFKSVKVRKPCREVAERAQAAPARLIRKRGVRKDDAGAISMTDDQHLS